MMSRRELEIELLRFRLVITLTVGHGRELAALKRALIAAMDRR